MNRLFVLSTLGLFALSAYACSDDDTKPNPVTTTSDAGGSDGSTTTSDGGGGSDSSTTTDSAVADTGADAAAPALPCTDAELDAPSADFTGTDAGGQGAGGADISFPTAQAARSTRTAA